MPNRCILWSGLEKCFNSEGREIPCHDTGQDAEIGMYRPWPEPRFSIVDEDLVVDQVTKLVWTRNGCLADFPLSWREALDMIDDMNSQNMYGRQDWRLPNRREMRSLIDHSSRNPALTQDHPFSHVALGWYWTSTTATLDKKYAWYAHLAGGRMFYGKKTEYCWLWPVCGRSPVLPRTGQLNCFDEQGVQIACKDTGCDGDRQAGVKWPEPRFVEVAEGIADRLTGLVWHVEAVLQQESSDWSEALNSVKSYAKKSGKPWRLPTINEMESLVDASQHTPALPANYPFSDVHEAYWTSTTSGYETDWAYVLYMHKGAVGVGYKKNREFHVWPVLSR